MSADKYHRSMYFRAKLTLLFSNIYSVLRQGFSRTHTLVSNIKLFSGSLRSRPGGQSPPQTNLRLQKPTQEIYSVIRLVARKRTTPQMVV